TKSGNEAEELYKEAFEKYNLATTYKQDDHQVYYNWGVALMKLATIKSGNEAEELYEKAFEKYKLATTYKQDDHNAYDTWGLALVELAKTKSGSEAEELYNEAVEKNKLAIKYGGEAYNLACLYAIRNQKAEALKYLEQTLARNEITVDFVEQDEDWKNLRNDPDFQDLLSRYKK
ncbi:tetratricopeptide repeat protein, partial [Alloprevotella tannerae]